jgi:dipeptidyl aminopeptidase/acylaminoacyl peptidase
VVGTPVNVTHRPGYDNQPSFSADGRSLFFTSVREDAQADIYRYDLQTRTIVRVTSTPESEYSATSFGDGTRFSAIRVEKDSTQRLWSFRVDGSDPQLVLENIKPVGYHAWVDTTTLALFVLGSPSSLQLVDRSSGRGEVVAHDIGRSLVTLPGGNAFSYVQRAPDSSLTLVAVDVRPPPPSRRWTARPLVTLPRGSDYVAWLESGVALAGQDSRLLQWNVRTPRSWTPMADFSRAGLRRISRLAISPDHRWIALVAEPANSP